MSDTPKPPPLPLHIVRPWSPREQELRQKLADANLALEAERATVQVLRQKYSKRTGAQEDTLPGVGAPKGAVRTFKRRRLARGARRLGKWALLGTALGLAAQLASVRYPWLVGPLDFAKDLFQQLVGGAP